MLFRWISAILACSGVVKVSMGQTCVKDHDKKSRCCGTESYRSPYGCCETQSHEGAHSDFVVYDRRYYTCCGAALHLGKRRCCGDILDYDPYFWTCKKGNLERRILGPSWRLPGCNRALGMRSYDIPNSSITASSSDSNDTGPLHARLHTDTGGGAWCPASPVTQEGHEWLMVDLGRLMFVTFITTQGRYNLGQGQEFVERYKLEYQQAEDDVWQPYDYTWSSVKKAKIFKGNDNTYEPVRNRLVPPIIARRVRIIPYSDQPKSVCLRLELFGCKFTGEYESSTPSDSAESDSNATTDLLLGHNTGTEGSGDDAFQSVTKDDFTPNYEGNITITPKETMAGPQSRSDPIYVQVILGVVCTLLLVMLSVLLYRYLLARKLSSVGDEVSKPPTTYYDDVINHPNRIAAPDENIYDDIELDMYDYIPGDAADAHHYNKPESSQHPVTERNVYTQLNTPQSHPPMMHPIRTDEFGYMLPASEHRPRVATQEDYIDMNGASATTGASAVVGPSAVTGASPLFGDSPLPRLPPRARPSPMARVSPIVGTSVVTETTPAHEASSVNEKNSSFDDYSQPDANTETTC